MYQSNADAPPGSYVDLSGEAAPIQRTGSGGLLGFLEGAGRVYSTFETTRAAIDDAKRTRTTTTSNPTIPAPNVQPQAEKPWTERPEVLIGLGVLAFLLRG